jgi:hypothetical protein
MFNLHNVKLTYKHIIVRLSLITLFVSGVTLPAFIPSPLPVIEVEAQTCSPYGYYNFSNHVFYDWIANGGPSDSSCWSKDPNRVSVVPTTCGWTSNAWEFYYGGYITQTFTIPSNWTYPNFSIDYILDFDDPNNDPWNRFSMQVRDLTTGALLASDFYHGGMGALHCSGRSQLWSQNLAGHQIQVRFQGTRGYPNTFIRVSFIRLYQQIF